jgi:hypothetical protein
MRKAFTIALGPTERTLLAPGFEPFRSVRNIMQRANTERLHELIKAIDTKGSILDKTSPVV